MINVIILAAGIGKRSTLDKPKCLLEVGGVSLLERHLKHLRCCGITHVSLVVGFKAASIKKTLDLIDSSNMEIRLIHNRDFRHGSTISLLCASDILENEHPTVIMDADVLCHQTIYTTVTKPTKKNIVLIDRLFEAGEEPVKVCIENSRIVTMDKKIPEHISYDMVGESVGFFHLQPELSRKIVPIGTKHLAQDPNTPHEWVLRELIESYPEQFAWRDVTGIPWIEIDFPQDITKAKEVILPKI